MLFIKKEALWISLPLVLLVGTTTWAQDEDPFAACASLNVTLETCMNSNGCMESCEGLESTEATEAMMATSAPTEGGTFDMAAMMEEMNAIMADQCTYLQSDVCAFRSCCSACAADGDAMYACVADQLAMIGEGIGNVGAGILANASDVLGEFLNDGSPTAAPMTMPEMPALNFTCDLSAVECDGAAASGTDGAPASGTDGAPATGTDGAPATGTGDDAAAATGGTAAPSGAASARVVASTFAALAGFMCLWIL